MKPTSIHSLDPKRVADKVACPRCAAAVNAPCVATVPHLGHGKIGSPIRGHHAERVDAAREVFA